MSGGQTGGKQSIFVGDMRAGFIRLAALRFLARWPELRARSYGQDEALNHCYTVWCRLRAGSN